MPPSAWFCKIRAADRKEADLVGEILAQLQTMFLWHPQIDLKEPLI
jgi:hypothetical protein